MSSGIESLAQLPPTAVLGASTIDDISTLMQSDDIVAAVSSVLGIFEALEPPTPTGAASTASTGQWEPRRLAFVTLASIGRKFPVLFEDKAVVNYLVSKWLRAGLPCGLSNALLACALLEKAFKEREVWPVSLVEAYVRDVVGSEKQKWSDQPECEGFVANIHCAWRQANSSLGEQDELSTKRLFASSARETLTPRLLQAKLLDIVMRRLAILEAADTSAGARGALGLLREWCPNSAASREIASRHLERWLRSPALGDRAENLLMNLATCLAAAANTRSSRIRSSSLPSAIDGNESDFDLQHDSKALDNILSLRLRPAQTHLYIDAVSCILRGACQQDQAGNSSSNREHTPARTDFSARSNENTFLDETLRCAMKAIVRLDMSTHVASGASSSSSAITSTQHSGSSGAGGGSGSTDVLRAVVRLLWGKTSDLSHPASLNLSPHRASAAFGAAAREIIIDSARTRASLSTDFTTSGCGSDREPMDKPASSFDDALTLSLIGCISRLSDAVGFGRGVSSSEAVSSSCTLDTKATGGLCLLRALDQEKNGEGDGLDVVSFVLALIPPTAPGVHHQHTASISKDFGVDPALFGSFVHVRAVRLAQHLLSLKATHLGGIVAGCSTASKSPNRLDRHHDALCSWVASLVVAADTSKIVQGVTDAWCEDIARFQEDSIATIGNNGQDFLGSIRSAVWLLKNLTIVDASTSSTAAEDGFTRECGGYCSVRVMQRWACVTASAVQAVGKKVAGAGGVNENTERNLFITSSAVLGLLEEWATQSALTSRQHMSLLAHASESTSLVAGSSTQTHPLDLITDALRRVDWQASLGVPVFSNVEELSLAAREFHNAVFELARVPDAMFAQALPEQALEAAAKDFAGTAEVSAAWSDLWWHACKLALVVAVGPLAFMSTNARLSVTCAAGLSRGDALAWAGWVWRNVATVRCLMESVVARDFEHVNSGVMASSEALRSLELGLVVEEPKVEKQDKQVVSKKESRTTKRQRVVSDNEDSDENDIPLGILFQKKLSIERKESEFAGADEPEHSTEGNVGQSSRRSQRERKRRFSVKDLLAGSDEDEDADYLDAKEVDVDEEVASVATSANSLATDLGSRKTKVSKVLTKNALPAKSVYSLMIGGWQGRARPPPSDTQLSLIKLCDLLDMTDTLRRSRGSMQFELCGELSPTPSKCSFLAATLSNFIDIEERPSSFLPNVITLTLRPREACDLISALDVSADTSLSQTQAVKRAMTWLLPFLQGRHTGSPPSPHVSVPWKAGDLVASIHMLPTKSIALILLADLATYHDEDDDANLNSSGDNDDRDSSGSQNLPTVGANADARIDDGGHTSLMRATPLPPADKEALELSFSVISGGGSQHVALQNLLLSEMGRRISAKARQRGDDQQAVEEAEQGGVEQVTCLLLRELSSPHSARERLAARKLVAALSLRVCSTAVDALDGGDEGCSQVGGGDLETVDATKREGRSCWIQAMKLLVDLQACPPFDECAARAALTTRRTPPPLPETLLLPKPTVKPRQLSSPAVVAAVAVALCRAAAAESDLGSAAAHFAALLALADAEEEAQAEATAREDGGAGNSSRSSSDGLLGGAFVARLSLFAAATIVAHKRPVAAKLLGLLGEKGVPKNNLTPTKNQESSAGIQGAAGKSSSGRGKGCNCAMVDDDGGEASSSGEEEVLEKSSDHDVKRSAAAGNGDDGGGGGRRMFEHASAPAATPAVTSPLRTAVAAAAKERFLKSQHLFGRKVGLATAVVLAGKSASNTDIAAAAASSSSSSSSSATATMSLPVLGSLVRASALRFGAAYIRSAASWSPSFPPSDHHDRPFFSRALGADSRMAGGDGDGGGAFPACSQLLAQVLAKLPEPAATASTLDSGRGSGSGSGSGRAPLWVSLPTPSAAAEAGAGGGGGGGAPMDARVLLGLAALLLAARSSTEAATDTSSQTFLARGLFGEAVEEGSSSGNVYNDDGGDDDDDGDGRGAVSVPLLMCERARYPLAPSSPSVRALTASSSLTSEKRRLPTWWHSLSCHATLDLCTAAAATATPEAEAIPWPSFSLSRIQRHVQKKLATPDASTTPATTTPSFSSSSSSPSSSPPPSSSVAEMWLALCESKNRAHTAPPLQNASSCFYAAAAFSENCLSSTPTRAQINASTPEESQADTTLPPPSPPLPLPWSELEAMATRVATVGMLSEAPPTALEHFQACVASRVVVDWKEAVVTSSLRSSTRDTGTPATASSVSAAVLRGVEALLEVVRGVRRGSDDKASPPRGALAAYSSPLLPALCSWSVPPQTSPESEEEAVRRCYHQMAWMAHLFLDAHNQTAVFPALWELAFLGRPHSLRCNAQLTSWALSARDRGLLLSALSWHLGDTAKEAGLRWALARLPTTTIADAVTADDADSPNDTAHRQNARLGLDWLQACCPAPTPDARSKVLRVDGGASVALRCLAVPSPSSVSLSSSSSSSSSSSRVEETEDAGIEKLTRVLAWALEAAPRGSDSSSPAAGAAAALWGEWGRRAKSVVRLVTATSEADIALLLLPLQLRGGKGVVGSGDFGTAAAITAERVRVREVHGPSRRERIATTVAFLASAAAATSEDEDDAGAEGGAGDSASAAALRLLWLLYLAAPDDVLSACTVQGYGNPFAASEEGGGSGGSAQEEEEEEEEGSVIDWDDESSFAWTLARALSLSLPLPVPLLPSASQLSPASPSLGASSSNSNNIGSSNSGNSGGGGSKKRDTAAVASQQDEEATVVAASRKRKKQDDGGGVDKDGGEDTGGAAKKDCGERSAGATEKRSGKKTKAAKVPKPFADRKNVTAGGRPLDAPPPLLSTVGLAVCSLATSSKAATDAWWQNTHKTETTTTAARRTTPWLPSLPACPVAPTGGGAGASSAEPTGSSTAFRAVTEAVAELLALAAPTPTAASRVEAGGKAAAAEGGGGGEEGNATDGDDDEESAAAASNHERMAELGLVLRQFAHRHPLLVLACLPTLTHALWSDAANPGQAQQQRQLGEEASLSPGGPGGSAGVGRGRSGSGGGVLSAGAASAATQRPSSSPPPPPPPPPESRVAAKERAANEAKRSFGVCFNWDNSGGLSCVRGEGCKFFHDMTLTQASQEKLDGGEAGATLGPTAAADAPSGDAEGGGGKVLTAAACEVKPPFRVEPFPFAAGVSYVAINGGGGGRGGGGGENSRRGHGSSLPFTARPHLWGSSFHEALWRLVVVDLVACLPPRLLLKGPQGLPLRIGSAGLLECCGRLLSCQQALENARAKFTAASTAEASSSSSSSSSMSSSAPISRLALAQFPRVGDASSSSSSSGGGAAAGRKVEKGSSLATNTQPARADNVGVLRASEVSNSSTVVPRLVGEALLGLLREAVAVQTQQEQQTRTQALAESATPRVDLQEARELLNAAPNQRTAVEAAVALAPMIEQMGFVLSTAEGEEAAAAASTTAEEEEETVFW